MMDGILVGCLRTLGTCLRQKVNVASLQSKRKNCLSDCLIHQTIVQAKGASLKSALMLVS
jgi:hypothetical protein